MAQKGILPFCCQMNQHKAIAEYELSDVGSLIYTFLTAELFKNPL